MSLVLDCSATLRWDFKDEQDDAAMALLDRVVRYGAVVPFLWRTEVANGLLVGERRKRLAAADADAFMLWLADLPIDDQPPPSWSQMADVRALARAHKPTIYDAVYLELALRLTIPLATFDDALRKAAGAAGVTVV